MDITQTLKSIVPYSDDMYSQAIVALTTAFTIASPCSGLKSGIYGIAVATAGISAYKYYLKDGQLPEVVTDAGQAFNDWVYEPVSNYLTSQLNSTNDLTEL